jgi:hypothetical protein
VKVILVSMLLLCSCSLSTKENKAEQLPSESYSKVIKSDFKDFWNDLGKALRVNDTIALDKYLDSAIILYGRADEDPRFKLRRLDRINKVREIYLTGGTYDVQNDSSISYKNFFLNRKALDREYVEGQDYQNIEDFIFNKNKWGEWKLIGVYCDTKGLKK